MLTKTLFFALFLLGSLGAFAQTKLIFHKSHSGSLESFENALEDDFFDLKLANFGIPTKQQMRIKKKTKIKLDSLIFLSDSVAVMVKSSHYPKKYYSQQQVRVSKDTIYHHQLFSKQHHLDSIKKVLKAGYDFDNNINKTVFVGYDDQANEKKHQKRKKKNKALKNTTSNSPTKFGINEPSKYPSNLPNGLLYALIGVVFLLASATGILVRQFTQLKQGI